MYRITRHNESKRIFNINGIDVRGRDLIAAIEDNFETILNGVFGEERLSKLKVEYQEELKFQFEIEEESEPGRIRVAIKNSQTVLDEMIFPVFKQDVAEQQGSVVINIEQEKFFGQTELAEYIGIDKRKLSTYYGRGKVIKPSFFISNRPIWIGADIENKELIEKARGKRYDE